MAESQLHLGMQAEIEGGPGSDDAHGFAHAIHIHSALVGPVTAVDTAAGTLTVLGQTVTVDAQTAFDTGLANGLASVTVGAVVQVHGQFDTASNSVPRHPHRARRRRHALQDPRHDHGPRHDGQDAVHRRHRGRLQHAPRACPPTSRSASWSVVRLATTPVAGVWTATAIADGQRLCTTTTRRTCAA